MCGRFSQLRSWNDLVRLYRITAAGSPDAWPPRYNLAPSQYAAVVTATGEAADAERCLQPMRWGLVPFWAKDAKIGNNLINARAETVATKPAFRQALAKRRCVIPTDGFFEWQSVPGRKRKQPFRISWQPPDAPLAFAGLWDRWTNPADGAQLLSFTIITTEANERVRRVHHRMPVILEEAQQALWLDVPGVDAKAAQELLLPIAPDRLALYPISTLVNAPANDTPDVIAPLEPSACPPLAGSLPLLSDMNDPS